MTLYNIPIPKPCPSNETLDWMLQTFWNRVIRNVTYILKATIRA